LFSPFFVFSVIGKDFLRKINYGWGGGALWSLWLITVFLMVDKGRKNSYDILLK